MKPLLIGLLTAAVCAAVLLYRRGVLTTKCVAASRFVFHTGKSEVAVRVGSCTGWVRHAAGFRGSRAVALALDAQLSSGEATVTLLNQKAGRPLCRLTPACPRADMNLEPAGRYALRWDFKDATGTCSLRWRAAK